MIDAERAGAGIGSAFFDFNLFIAFSKNYQPNQHFKCWVASSERKIMEQMQ